MNKRKSALKIEDIKSPNDIKELSISELENLSSDIRKFILEKCSINGGHLSSNLGLVELELALYYFFNAPIDKIFFDVGHQCYTEKILTGRKLEKLRKKDGDDGFLNMKESEYDTFEAGHSSTSVGTALGYAYARDITNEKYKIISVIGDASFSNGVVFEAINNLYNYKKQFLIIVNDNEMAIGKTVGGFSKFLKDASCNALNNFNLRYVGPIDGNNIEELLKTFESIKDLNEPILLHVKTKKGKGYSFSEEDCTGKFHYIKPFNIEDGNVKEKNDNNKISFSNLYSDLLDQEMYKNDRLVAITPATSLGSSITKLFLNHKERCFDVGINEEHALLFANGLALSKKIHPYIFIYSTFLQRAYDELIHDIGRMDTNVTILVDRIGMVGEDGCSHQGIYDLSFLMNIPNLTICSASNYEETVELFKFSLNFSKPLIIRYPNSLCENKYDLNLDSAKSIIPFEWKKIKNSISKDKCLISYGPHLKELKDLIEKEHIDIELINALFLKPINFEFLKELLDYKEIIIYDPYSVKSGFSMHLESALIDLGFKNNIKIISIDDKYVEKDTILGQEIDNNVDVNYVLNYLKGKYEN